MMMCWNEDPEERPSFSDIIKLLDNRMSSIAGYLDVDYNPFIFSDYDSLECPEYSKIEELPLAKASVLADSQVDRKKPQIKPRTKKPTIHITVDNPIADSGHYY